MRGREESREPAGLVVDGNACILPVAHWIEVVVIVIMTSFFNGICSTNRFEDKDTRKMRGLPG